MSRYAQQQQLADRPLDDGDNGFLGFVSNRQSPALAPGILERSRNLRIDNLTVRCRDGLEPVSTDLTLSNPPVLLDVNLGNEYSVTSITRSATTATVTTATAHGWTTGQEVEIRGAAQSAYNGIFTITVTGATTFTYTVGGSPASPATGTIYAASGPTVFDEYSDRVRCSCQFATNDTDRTEYVILASHARAFAVRAGVASQVIDYPANEYIEDTDTPSMMYWNGRVFLFRGYKSAAAVAISSITQAAGTATCTTSAAHGLATGDWVFIQDATPLGYCGIVQVTVTDSTHFTYAVNSGLASPATLDGATVRKCKRPLAWNGDFASDFTAMTTGANSTTTGTLIHVPPVPWGLDAGSRLAVPFKPDQIVISDPWDEDSLDLQYNEFRLRYGSFDSIVGALNTQKEVLFVLCRRSLHRLLLADLSVAAAEEITRDVGCAARKTICQWGDQVLFVGDRAIHRVRVTGELSLIPERVPLSADIQDILATVNWSAIGHATARIWNNRAYFALPDSEGLNTIIVLFNFINDKWETQDEYPAGFDVEDWHVMDYQGEKRLFASTTYGFLYLLEKNAVDTFGNTSSQQNYDVSGTGRTRYYTGGTRAVKRCRRMFMHTDVPAAAVVTAYVATQNPDMTGDSITVDENTAEDGRYPVYAGVNGSGAQLRFTLTARAELRAVEVDFAGERSRGYARQT